MKLQYSLTSILLFVLQSLAQTQDYPYELKLVDSIQIESLEQIQITDYSPTKNRFLAYATQSKICIEVDANGNVISKVDLNGEGPGHFGRGMTHLSYLGEDIIINGPNVYFVYDGDWNYKKRLVYTSGGAWLPLGMIPGTLETYVSDGEAHVIKPVDHNYFGHKKLPNNYFSSANLIEVTTLNSEESKKQIKYPEGSIYLSNSTYYDRHKAILSYNTKEEAVYLALSLEPKIYVYSTENFSLLSTINLELKDFRTPQGIPFEAQHKNGRSGFGPTNQLNTVYNYVNSGINSLSSEGEITIISYRTGTKRKTSAKSIKEAREEFDKENQFYTAFYKNGRKVLEIPRSYNRIIRISETRFLTHDISVEEELDYSNFHIYELQKVK